MTRHILKGIERTGAGLVPGSAVNWLPLGAGFVAENDGRFIELFSQDAMVDWRVSTGHGAVRRFQFYRTGPAGSFVNFEIPGPSCEISYRIRGNPGASVSAETGLKGAAAIAQRIYAASLECMPTYDDIQVRVGDGGDDIVLAAPDAGRNYYPPGATRRGIFEFSDVLDGTLAGAGIRGYVQSGSYGTAEGSIPGMVEPYNRGTKIVVDCHPWEQITLVNNGTDAASCLITWQAKPWVK